MGGLAGGRAGWSRPSRPLIPALQRVLGVVPPHPHPHPRPRGARWAEGGPAAALDPRGSAVSHCRKCKLVTTGPWLEVAPLALTDVSIIPESPGANRSGHSIALWAVSDKGDVLCRLGVSELNPAVSTLVHLPALAPFQGVLADSAQSRILDRSLAGLRPPRGLPRTVPGTSSPWMWPEGVTRFGGSWS